VVEVLIVGAGPAGSTAAIRLARAGREVLLVDRCRFPRQKPCGEYYNPEACRLLADLGLLEKAEAAGAHRVEALALAASAGCGLVVPFAGIAPAGCPALSLGREVLDSLLVDEARRAGVTVWEEALVREPLGDERCVEGALIERQGVQHQVRARITLAADGLRSRFARRLGLAGPEPARRTLGLAARYRAAEGVPPRVLMSAATDGCCGLALRGGEANLGMVVSAGRAREVGGNPAAFFDAALSDFPDLRSAVMGEPLGVRAVGRLTWMTRRQSTGGCLLLGDAAGFYDPFTGQGVTFALLTAELAAEVTHAALCEEDVSADRLAEYSNRRHLMLAPRVLVQRAIQSVIAHPRLLARVVERLGRRPDVARTLIGVIADVTPATRAFTPAFLARLVL